MNRAERILFPVLVFFVIVFALSSIVQEITLTREDSNKKEKTEAVLMSDSDRQQIRREAVLSSLKELELPLSQLETEEQQSAVLYDVPLGDSVQQHLINKCSDANIDPKLMLAIIEHESRFQPDVVSATHDYGLCQINRCHLDKFYSEYGDNIFDPYANISYGVDLLSYYMGKADENERQALLMYQYGESGAKGRTTSKAVEEILKIKERIICKIS